jgi:hypothetical protein
MLHNTTQAIDEVLPQPNTNEVFETHNYIPWVAEEEELLHDLRGRYEQVPPRNQRAAMWQSISEEFTQRGFDRTGEQCRKKYDGARRGTVKNPHSLMQHTSRSPSEFSIELAKELTETTKRTPWLPEEIKLLLELRRPYGERKSVGENTGGFMWRSISEDLQDHGFDRTPEQCKWRYHNLMRVQGHLLDQDIPTGAFENKGQGPSRKKLVNEKPVTAKSLWTIDERKLLIRLRNAYPEHGTR